MQTKRGQGGFTLVEIAVSLLVIGVGFTSLLSVFAVGIKWSQDVRKDTTVMDAIHSAVDDLPNQGDAAYTHDAMGYRVWVYAVGGNPGYRMVVTTGDAANSITGRLAVHYTETHE